MLDKSNLSHLFELSKISATEIEKDEFLRDMNNIIEVMDMVKTVDKDTKPLRQNAVSFSSLREDLVYINDDFEKIENSDLSIPKII